MDINNKVKVMKNLIVMIEETVFTKEMELEFANLEKLTDKSWQPFVEKTQYEIKVLTSKLAFYEARLKEFENENSNDTESR